MSRVGKICKAKIDSPIMRPFQSIHLETGLESDGE